MLVSCVSWFLCRAGDCGFANWNFYLTRWWCTLSKSPLNGTVFLVWAYLSIYYWPFCSCIASICSRWTPKSSTHTLLDDWSNTEQRLPNIRPPVLPFGSTTNLLFCTIVVHATRLPWDSSKPRAVGRFDCKYSGLALTRYHNPLWQLTRASFSFTLTSLVVTKRRMGNILEGRKNKGDMQLGSNRIRKALNPNDWKLPSWDSAIADGKQHNAASAAYVANSPSSPLSVAQKKKAMQAPGLGKYANDRLSSYPEPALLLLHPGLSIIDLYPTLP